MLLEGVYLILFLSHYFLQISHALPSQSSPKPEPSERPPIPIISTTPGEGPFGSPSQPPTPPRGRHEWSPGYGFDVGHHGCSLKVLDYGSRTRSASYLDALWKLLDYAYDYVDDPRHVSDRHGLLPRFYMHLQWPPPVHGYGLDPPPLMSLALEVTEAGALLREDLRSVLGRLHLEVQFSGKPAVELMADVMIRGKVKAIIVVEFRHERGGLGGAVNGTMATA